MSDKAAGDDRPAAPAGISRRRAGLYLGVVVGISLAGWGLARAWEWGLHQPALKHYRSGMALSQAGRTEAALEEWQAATVSEPWWPEPYFRLAEGLEATGQPEAAIGALRRAETASPKAAHVTCRIAEVYGRMQDQVGASEWAAVAVKKEPDCSRAHLIYARTHRGRLADTLEHYRRAYSLSHDDEILLGLAKTQAQSGDLKAAEATVADYLARQPANGETHYLLGFILARRAHDAPSVQEAAGHLEAALQQDAARYDAHAELGLLYERRRDWNLARQHFEKARALNPYSATILFHLATVLRQTRDPEATKLWDRVRTLQAKERRWREARQELLSKPGDLSLRLETASLSHDLGADRIARSLVLTVLQQDPENAKARRLLEKLQ